MNCSMTFDLRCINQGCFLCCEKTVAAADNGCRDFCFGGKMENEQKTNEQKLSPQEESLIKHIRGLKYGSVTVFIQNGTPIRIEQIKESIQLK